MEIGKPRRKHVVEPIVNPVPRREPAILPPDPRRPEKVPAKQ